MEWETISTEACIGNLYDEKGRLVAVIIQNGIAVIPKCSIEGHYLMKDDFLTGIHETVFMDCGRIHEGVIYFSKLAEEIFDVKALEEIAKQTYKTLTA